MPAATSDVADANYLYYGAWLQRTANAGGTDTYNEVETFAGAVGHTDSGSVTDVSGIAEYEGGAAGVYVHKTFAQDGTSEATSGHFSADASLTAYFSGGATPAEKADTLVGTNRQLRPVRRRGSGLVGGPAERHRSQHSDGIQS